MKIPVLTVVVLLLPSIALSQTLCRKGEIDYFSCKTTANEKIVSVCGNITNGEINDDSWLQDRFGKTGAIELIYPKQTQGSVRKFEGNYFNTLNVIDLRFINGKTLYGVALNDSYRGDDAQKRFRPSGGIGVEISKMKRVNIHCQKVDTRKYLEIFRLLNISLRTYNGETDFLYYFYNHVSR